jgi:hypothetical protein
VSGVVTVATDARQNAIGDATVIVGETFTFVRPGGAGLR